MEKPQRPALPSEIGRDGGGQLLNRSAPYHFNAKLRRGTPIQCAVRRNIPVTAQAADTVSQVDGTG